MLDFQNCTIARGRLQKDIDNFRHNGTISEEALRVWKKMIVAANEAWSKNTLNNLLFSDSPYSNAGNNFAKVVYVVRLSNKGEQLIEAWKEGSLKKLDSAFRNHELKWIL